jgi:putative N6-adenine-specific DNA methylase
MESWRGVGSSEIASIRQQAKSEIRPSLNVRIVMSDRDAGACEAAASNADRAGVADDVDIIQRSLSETQLRDIGDSGLLLTNPPYGQRISEGADLRGLYARLSDVIRGGGKGWRAAVLVPDRQLVSQMRIPLETLLRTSNGGTPVALETTVNRRNDSIRRAGDPHART